MCIQKHPEDVSPQSAIFHIARLPPSLPFPQLSTSVLTDAQGWSISSCCALPSVISGAIPEQMYSLGVMWPGLLIPWLSCAWHVPRSPARATETLPIAVGFCVILPISWLPCQVILAWLRVSCRRIQTTVAQERRCRYQVYVGVARQACGHRVAERVRRHILDAGLLCIFFTVYQIA